MDIALAVLGAVALWCAVALGVAVVVGRMCARRDGQVSVRDDAHGPPPRTTDGDPSTHSHRPGA
ncbi:hypothetical protein [Pseudonocardia sp.]|uniref:hypothetical protein n=1 Tax=Pseudonocardia sp. TaxID=60912 RepID=UPI003D096DD1